MNNSQFYKKLTQKILLSLINDYTDNFDTERFGTLPGNNTLPEKLYNSKFFSARFLNKSNYVSLLKTANNIFSDEMFDGFETVYELLADNDSRELLIDIVAYRLLGYKRVKLPLNNPEHWAAIERVAQLENTKLAIETNIPEYKTLPFFDVTSLGYDIKLNFIKSGILADFILEQYHYKSKEKSIGVDSGDIAIDAGGCWGDTALYFAAKAGPKGHVYSFEFIPNNIKIHKKNTAQNPQLAQNIEIIQHPVWETDNVDFFYVDRGPASSVSLEKKGNEGGSTVKSKTIDTLVIEKNLPRVDFIKMDIEGAEPYALKGAEQTIRKFKPKLAIAIYHSISDFVNIPKYIDSLGLGYKFYLGHFTIHEEETILFATTD